MFHIFLLPIWCCYFMVFFNNKNKTKVCYSNSSSKSNNWERDWTIWKKTTAKKRYADHRWNSFFSCYCCWSLKHIIYQRWFFKTLEYILFILFCWRIFMDPVFALCTIFNLSKTFFMVGFLVDSGWGMK